MTKDELVRLLCVLSALEALAWTRSDTKLDYLLDELNELGALLRREILK